MFNINCHLLLAPLLLYGVVTAIEFPGSKCPEVPPTHKKTCFYTQTDTIFSIPFSPGKPTHLFMEMSETDLKENNYDIVVTANDDEAQGLTGFELFERGNRSALILDFVADNNFSFTMKSTYSDGNPIFEDVRVWCDEPFYFIWSCVEGKDETAVHEEALIILKEAYTLSKVDLRSVSLKYLGSHLMGLINLEKEANGRY